jgi:hypothetical protein
MTRYSFAVIGADNAAAHLRIMASNTLSFEDAFENIGEAFRDQVHTQFDRGGKLVGVRGIGWKPLRPTSVYRYLKRRDRRTGRLAASYHIKGADGNISETSAMSGKFGSKHRRDNNAGQNIPLAIYMQEGTRKMTPRPVSLYNRQLSEQIVEEIAEHLFNGWG